MCGPLLVQWCCKSLRLDGKGQTRIFHPLSLWSLLDCKGIVDLISGVLKKKGKSKVATKVVSTSLKIVRRKASSSNSKVTHSEDACCFAENGPNFFWAVPPAWSPVTTASHYILRCHLMNARAALDRLSHQHHCIPKKGYLRSIYIMFGTLQ